MNQNAAINAVYGVLNTNKAVVVSGITHQGISRELQHIFRSNLTAWMETYAVTIHCPAATEKFSEPSANTVRGRAQVTYSMEIHVVDTAFPQTSDTNQLPFEQMHSDFRTVVARIVRLVKDTTVAFTSGGVELRLTPFSPVKVDERTSWFDNGQESYPMLYSIIHFELTDYCADSSLV